jgi:hypothetical protein
VIANYCMQRFSVLSWDIKITHARLCRIYILIPIDRKVWHNCYRMA